MPAENFEQKQPDGQRLRSPYPALNLTEIGRIQPWKNIEYWPVKKLVFKRDEPLICGIVNVTPDSFSDGGLYLKPDAAVDRALQLEAQGAALVDIGAESSRPGAAPVSESEELERLLPVVREAVLRLKIPVSVDTYKPAVAKACLEAGASYINDISGFSDPLMGKAVAGTGAGVIVMHMLGSPATMQKAPVYTDVVASVAAFLKERVLALRALGVNDIILDPGIGFGKTLEHNLDLIVNIPGLKALGCPVMLGVSRKSFIGAISGAPAQERLGGTIAACVISALNGADILRVHDAAQVKQALAVAFALKARTPGIR